MPTGTCPAVVITCSPGQHQPEVWLLEDASKPLHKARIDQLTMVPFVQEAEPTSGDPCTCCYIGRTFDMTLFGDVQTADWSRPLPSYSLASHVSMTVKLKPGILCPTAFVGFGRTCFVVQSSSAESGLWATAQGFFCQLLSTAALPAGAKRCWSRSFLAGGRQPSPPCRGSCCCCQRRKGDPCSHSLRRSWLCA